MSLERLPSTRLNLLRAERRLQRVQKGAALLRRKREALVSELFKLARPAADARRQIEDGSRRGYQRLLAALAIHGQAGLRALAWPERDLRVEIEAAQVWGVPVASIVSRPPLTRTIAARGAAPGRAGPMTVGVAAEFERLTELLLDAATREMLIRRLGEALSQASRQVHTLERRVAPTLLSQMGSVRRTLEEREREEHLRLKHLSRRRSQRQQTDLFKDSEAKAGLPSTLPA
ncbi:MAG: V-type ATP synthase subunit D [Gemmatimonadota bacterium]|nr:V-type ATP synthase subunit D [Gemmatimonadota bacterium]